MKTRIIIYLLFILLFVCAGSASAYSEGSLDNYFGTGAGGTGGLYNSFFGAYAGDVNTGYYNTFLGYESGFNNTGYYNTFLGYESGLNNTTAPYNTFLGFEAGYYNTTGRNNTFIGAVAGFSNTTGDYNTFIGYYAGYSSTTGYRNIFLGNSAGYSNTTGIYNTFIGDEAGYHNTTGSYNTFLGYNTGNSNTTGYFNTFLGNTAGGSNTTGFYNTFMGYAAGFSNTTGSSNIFIGYRAGNNNTTGNYNTILGEFAGYSNTTGTGNVFLGYNVGYYETGSNKLYIDNSNTTTPLIYGEFDTRVVAIDGILGVGTMPAEGLHVYRTDKETILLAETDTGAGAGFRFIHNSSGGDWKAKITLTGDFKIRNQADGFDLMYFTKSNGYVGIGTNSPTEKLHVNGNVTADDYFYNSSREYKEEIESLSADKAMTALKELKPVTYRYRNNKEENHVGFIAEDVPELVANKGRKNLSPMDIVAVLTKVVQEQQKVVQEQQRKFDKYANEQQKTISELAEKVEKLEQELQLKNSLASVLN